MPTRTAVGMPPGMTLSSCQFLRRANSRARVPWANLFARALFRRHTGKLRFVPRRRLPMQLVAHRYGSDVGSAIADHFHHRRVAVGCHGQAKRRHVRPTRTAVGMPPNNKKDMAARRLAMPPSSRRPAGCFGARRADDYTHRFDDRDQSRFGPYAERGSPCVPHDVCCTPASARLSGSCCGQPY